MFDDLKLGWILQRFPIADPVSTLQNIRTQLKYINISNAFSSN